MIFIKPGHRVLFLLAEFMCLLACVIYIDIIYLTKVRPDQRASLNFTQTECMVMSKKLSTKGHVLRRYRADFLVSYQADGVQYNRWVSGNGLDMSYYRNNEKQEKLLSDFKNGGNYPCWYDPANPEAALLVERAQWTYFTPFIWPGVVALVILLLLISNAWYLVRLNKNNRFKI